MSGNIKNKLNSTRIIALGFLILILIGSLLLSLPISTRSRTATPYIDSLFTSVSATCVTGLIQYDTFTHWSYFGQAVILALIQIGGIGFMTVLTLFSLFLKRKIGLYERKLLMDNFNIEFERKKNIIENYMKEDLKENNLSYKTVISAMKYSINAGGKRIRPILLMSVYELFRDDYETIFPFMAGIEYIHTYSLIHDDLPAMDNDDLRRGLPTCHKQYSEAMAILAGDALLNYAYEKMLASDIPFGVDATRYILSAAGKDGSHYDNYEGIALETEFFPDSINIEKNPSVILRKGETYHSETRYTFKVNNQTKNRPAGA